MFEKTNMAIKYGQSRENDNTGHRRHRTKTNKQKTQHRKLKRWATHTLPKSGVDLMCSWSLTFSPSTRVTSTNKTDHHNIAEILLQVTLILITITQWPLQTILCSFAPAANCQSTMYFIGWLIRSRNCLPFASIWVHPQFLVGSVLFIFIVFCVVFIILFVIRLSLTSIGW